ncbi:hypothetical protein ABZP36_031329 [Zizania latifolia]
MPPPLPPSPLSTSAQALTQPVIYEFLNSKPPPNYVVGLGRGATGFTTHLDIGPAHVAPDLPDRSATSTAPAMMMVVMVAVTRTKDMTRIRNVVWESIDKRMDSRRKDRREAQLKQEIKKYHASNPKITEKFADLKRKLADLSAQE